MAERTAAAEPLKLWVGSSAGGHTNQLLSLLSVADDWPCQPVGCVTSLDIVREELERIAPTEVVGECHRKRPIAAVGVLWRSFRVVAKHRPDVLVTTGSLPIALVAIWVRIFGGRVVWIDSVAQVGSMSMSGRLVSRFADLALVQWPDLVEDNPTTEYVGQLL